MYLLSDSIFLPPCLEGEGAWPCSCTIPPQGQLPSSLERPFHQLRLSVQPRCSRPCFTHRILMSATEEVLYSPSTVPSTFLFGFRLLFHLTSFQ